MQKQLELRARNYIFYYQKHFYGTALEGAISADAVASGKSLHNYGVSEMHQHGMLGTMFWQKELKLTLKIKI